MQVSVRCRPAYAMAYVIMGYDEIVYIERGSMATMSAGVALKAGFGGEGLGRALKRKYLGGETLLFTECHAQVEGAWVAVSPAYPGDVDVIDLDHTEPMLVEAGSLLAYSHGVRSDVQFSGLRTVVMHEGITLIKLDGPGQAVLSAYGGIEEIPLGDGEEIIVDTGHLIGFSANLTFDVGALGGITTAVTTGEGLVARFQGPGRVLVQTRAEQAFRDWLIPESGQNTGH